jgi:tetratricopeptide (TPR) repeat protein
MKGRTCRRVWIISGLAITAALTAKPAWQRGLVAFEVYQARSALDNAEPEVALDWLHGAEESRPDRADVQYLLAVSKRRSGHLGEVMQHLHRAEALGWRKKDLKRQRMMMLFQMGSLHQAEPYLLKLIDDGAPDETAEEVYDALVRGYLTEFRVREAAVCLEHWIQWRPRSILPRIWRTEIYGAVNDIEQLQAELGEILRIDPRRLPQRISLANSLLDVSRVEQALAQYEIGQQQAPHDARVLLGLGLCHQRLGKTAEARRELESALGGQLDDAQRLNALMALGELASEATDLDQASRHFDAAVRLAPYEPAPVYAFGTTLSKMGEPELAKQHLERSGVLSQQAERLKEINRELIGFADDAALRVEAARIMRRQNRKEEAARWMISALRYEPTLREAHDVLADYFEEQGDVELAQRHRAAARDGTELAESAH